MSFFKAKKSIEITTSLKDITNDSVTLVTKKKSGRKGTYRVYINGWKYNVKGFPVKKEDKLKIDATYFSEGINRIQIITRENWFGSEKIYEEEFTNK